MTKITRQQAVEIVGEKAVIAVERENCDFTNRVMPESDDRVEFRALIECTDTEGNDVGLSAYYYPTQEELDDAGDDLSNVEWIVDSYEIN